MQTKNQQKPPNWKVMAGVAAVSAIGMGGLALADSTAVANPPPITLYDRETLSSGPEVTLREDLGFGVLNELDSPLDPGDTGDDLASAPGDTAAGLDTLTGDTGDEAAAEVEDDDGSEDEDSPVETPSTAEETESPDDADESPAG